jgi:hypothetical protein
MILSFGYLILRQALQLIILIARGERANAVEVLVLRHQVAVLLVTPGHPAAVAPQPDHPTMDLLSTAAGPANGHGRTAGVGATAGPRQPDLGL